jgi:hypothetical protein
MKIDLNDTFAIDGVRRTEDGYLTAFARVARTGIQEYQGKEVGRPDLGTVRIYRPESEVFAPDAMQSFAHRPITLTHPKVPVSAKNWTKYARGQTGNEVVRDGEYVRVPMVMMDQRLIDAYEKSGVRELSMGYSTDLKWETGKTPDGMTYDAIQTNIRGNHLAVVPRARGGDQLRIGDEYTEDDKDRLGHGSNKRGGSGGKSKDRFQILKELRSSGFSRKYKSSDVTEYEKKGSNGNSVNVQVWGDGNHRVSHFIRGVSSGKPTEFKSVSEMHSAITKHSKSAKLKDAVILDAIGDPNHGKVGVVLGLHPTDPSRTNVRFGDATVPYPTKYLRVVDEDPDEDDDDEDDDLISCPECGAEIPADSDDCPECGYELMKDSANQGDQTMKQIIIDGVPVDVVNDQGAMIVDRHIQKLETRVKDAETASGKVAVELADAKKTIEAKDGEIAVLKKQVEDAKVTPEKLDVMVKDRLAVIDRATTVLEKTFSFDGKSIEDIRRATVSARLGDAAKDMSDAAIEGAFIAMTADGGDKGGTRQLRDSLSKPRPITNSVDARDAAYADNVKSLSNNWRGKAAS